MTADGVEVSGPVLFARYAFPPNHLGYCGPDDAARFLAHGVNADDHGLREMARGFDGALPYLQLIADGNGFPDALDPRVVEAYWLGGPELDRVGPAALTSTTQRAFSGRSGPLFPGIEEALAAGALPHHSFAVFCVYPWVAMLGDPRRTPQAMIVLDRCRIRWGRVISIDGDVIIAEWQPLTWDGRRLALGPAITEPVRRAIDGLGLASPLAEGDLVALHWDWVCDRLTSAQRDVLRGVSTGQLELTNTTLARRAARNPVNSRG